MERDHGEKSEKHLSFPPVFLNNWLNSCVRGQFEIKMLIVLGHSDINPTFHMNFNKWACNHLKPVTCQRIPSKNTRPGWVDTWARDKVSETGQRIPCFDSCQLITTLMCNQFSHGLSGLPKQLESVRVNIGITVVRTDGLRRCTVTWLPNFLRWVNLLTHGAPLARFARGASLKYPS